MTNYNQRIRQRVFSGLDPEAYDPEVKGYCEACGEELREDYSYFKDLNDNTFCCEECAMRFYGIIESDWD